MTTKEVENLVSALKAVRGATDALLEDVARCHDALKPLAENFPNPTPVQREEGQFWLRMFTRAVFALVEGVSYTMRQSAIALHQEGQLRLSPGELFLLLEKRYSWDNGNLREVNTFNSVLDNFHIAFTVFPRAFGVDFQLDTGDHRYGSFQHAIKLRHAITHPKLPEDLQLSSQAISQIHDGVKWFSSEGSRMYRLCYDTIDPRVGEWHG
jgi:hypothetical protein